MASCITLFKINFIILWKHSKVNTSGDYPRNQHPHLEVKTRAKAMRIRIEAMARGFIQGRSLINLGYTTHTIERNKAIKKGQRTESPALQGGLLS